jgi:winged helix-turn-helix DNA-binding protein
MALAQKNCQVGKLTLDPRDLAISKCLQSDPRLGISELARQVELSIHWSSKPTSTRSSPNR